MTAKVFGYPAEAASHQKSTPLEAAGDAACAVACHAEGDVAADFEIGARAAIGDAASKALMQAQSLARVKSQM